MAYELNKIRVIKQFRTMIREDFGLELGLLQTKEIVERFLPDLEKLNTIICRNDIVFYTGDYHPNLLPNRTYQVIYIDNGKVAVLIDLTGNYIGTTHIDNLEKKVSG